LHGVLAYGPDALVGAVRALTGVPVHHYVEVEFSGLTSVIDRLGGVTLTLRLPARDPATGLDLPAGTQVLDGQDALSYVRSRQYEELTAVGWRAPAPGDLARIDRQHLLLRGLFTAVSSRCPSLGCLGVIRGLGRSLTVDAGFDGADVRRLLATLGRPGADVSLGTLPTRPERRPEDSVSPFPPVHLGSLGFRVLDQPAAAVVLDRLSRDVPRGSGDQP
jgi:LCP family protein required for cell wall assembly